MWGSPKITAVFLTALRPCFLNFKTVWHSMYNFPLLIQFIQFSSGRRATKMLFMKIIKGIGKSRKSVLANTKTRLLTYDMFNVIIELSLFLITMKSIFVSSCAFHQLLSVSPKHNSSFELFILNHFLKSFDLHPLLTNTLSRIVLYYQFTRFV